VSLCCLGSCLMAAGALLYAACPVIVTINFEE
jgi:hypothetical protein